MPYALLYELLVAYGQLVAVAIVISLVLALLLRAIARRENPTIFSFVPAQMHSLVTSESIADTDATKGGGNIVDVIHAIPGKKLNKDSEDPMNWYYEPGEEPKGILYHLLGIQFIGFFRYLRKNAVRTFRFGREGKEVTYRLMPKSDESRYVFFSGQHDVQMEHIETDGVLKIDLLFNIIFEESFPVRVRLRTADPYAVLTMMVTRLVISEMGGIDPKTIIGNKGGERQLLTDKIQAISSDVEKDLGITIKKVTLADLSFDPETRRLLELDKKTELENKAAVAVAEMKKRVQILVNDADADRIERVIKPAAQDERTVAVRIAEAYEKNPVVTTFAPGAGNTMIPLK